MGFFETVFAIVVALVIVDWIRATKDGPRY